MQSDEREVPNDPHANAYFDGNQMVIVKDKNYIQSPQVQAHEITIQPQQPVIIEQTSDVDESVQDSTSFVKHEDGVSEQPNQQLGGQKPAHLELKTPTSTL